MVQKIPFERTCGGATISACRSSAISRDRLCGQRSAALSRDCPSKVRWSASPIPHRSELKSVVAFVFFSSDVANPDTVNEFYADIELLAFQGGPPDPDRIMRSFLSRNIPNENKWQGYNLSRFVNRDCDATIDAATVETDPAKRASLYIKANDLLWQDIVLIPVMHRFKVAASL